jgi:hypothetical protein
MWPSIKPYRDWAMRDLWPFGRSAPQPLGLNFRYERAGLSIADQPIPWTAEAVVVEALLRLPASTGRRKSDFTLCIPERPPAPADQLRRVEGEDLFRVSFRAHPPGASVSARVLFRDRVLGEVALPALGRDEFLRSLRVEMPTLFVRLGAESVACQTFVPAQCRGLIATAMLVSPTGLAPLLDFELAVEFHGARDGSTFRAPACLTAAQLTGQTALLSVAPPHRPRHTGEWTATWRVGEHALAARRIRGVSRRRFQRSLRLSDARFIVQKDGEPFRLCLQPPVLEPGTQVGPCFLLTSSEPGMAGLCQVQVVAQTPGSPAPPVVLEQQVRITDGPTMAAPGTLRAAQLQQVAGFEVSVGGLSLGMLSLCPAPAATFTGEGGFRAAPDYPWTAAADEEMNDRLNRLLDKPAE